MKARILGIGGSQTDLQITLKYANIKRKDTKKETIEQRGKKGCSG